MTQRRSQFVHCQTTWEFTKVPVTAADLLMQDAPSLRTTCVHLLPSLGVADMQSDRQKNQPGKRRGNKEDRCECRAKEGKPTVV